MGARRQDRLTESGRFLSEVLIQRVCDCKMCGEFGISAYSIVQMTNGLGQYVELQPKKHRTGKQGKNKAAKTPDSPNASATYALIDHRLHNSIALSPRS